MPLLDRVATLIRANLNDLIDRAEDPEKLLKQLLLDMQNQYMQVKTQTAIAIADQHLLEGKKEENAQAQTEWVRRAELALAHGDEDLARAALERSLTHDTAAANFAEQLQDQAVQVTALRDTLNRLQAKMEEARTKMEVLIARHRRARVAMQMGGTTSAGTQGEQTLERLKAKVSEAEALAVGYAGANEPGALAKLDELERRDKVNDLLAELKRKKQLRQGC